MFDKSFNKNRTDEQGYTPLFRHAAMNNRMDAVQILLAAGAYYRRRCYTWGQTALCLAAVTGEKDVVRAIVEHGADVEAADRYGVTALHVSASYDNVEVLEVLVEAGADVEQESLNGRTPLHAAARNNCPAAVLALLKHGGASVRKQGGSGRSPLHLAIAAPGFRTIAEWWTFC